MCVFFLRCFNTHLCIQSTNSTWQVPWWLNKWLMSINYEKKDQFGWLCESKWKFYEIHGRGFYFCLKPGWYIWLNNHSKLMCQLNSRECGCIVQNSTAEGQASFESPCKVSLWVLGLIYQLIRVRVVFSVLISSWHTHVAWLPMCLSS